MTPTKITKQFLESKNACYEGMEWVEKNGLIGLAPIPFLNKLIEHDKLDWANWLIVRVMEYKQYVSYAVFAAEQVIEIYEREYPNDKRPREAIEAAKRCIKNPSTKNKELARVAQNAAYAAASAAAAYAAYAAAYAASDAAYAAYAAAYAASDAAAYAAYAAAYAVDAAKRKELKLKILTYGIGLMKK